MDITCYIGNGLVIQVVCVHRDERSRSENEKLALQRLGEGRVGVQRSGEGWIIRELENLRGCSCHLVEVQYEEQLGAAKSATQCCPYLTKPSFMKCSLACFD